MLEARGLAKTFGGIHAVRDVSFIIKAGEILGYLGPNGSGKSTTVKMVTGLITPTRGEVLFQGQPIQTNLVDFKRRLGYVPEEPHLYPYLTGREYLQLVGRLRELPENKLNEKIDALMELFGLREAGWAPVSSYSKGMKQKVLISAALLHDPDVLIFDEPLSGLDVTIALVFRNLVSALARKGKLILYSSHVLEVVEKICSQVIILHRGRVVADDSVENLRTHLARPSLEEVFAELVAQEDTEKVAAEIVSVMGL